MGKCVTPLKEWSSILENVHVTQGITLEALGRDKHQGIKLKQTQQIKDVVYRYLLTTGQGLLRYTSINLEEDLIIDSMFMIFKQQPCFFF